MEFLRRLLSIQSDLEQAGVRRENYPVPEPKAMGARGWSLLGPILASVVGFCAFAVLAYSFTVWALFTNEQLLPSAYRINLVIVGAVALAVGGEIGTPATVVEVFRKQCVGEAKTWDWSALVASLAATALTFLLAFGALLGIYASWSVVVTTWAPVALALIGALDAYAGMMEFGLFLGSFDQRHRDWEEGLKDWLVRAAGDVGLVGIESTTIAPGCTYQTEDKVLPVIDRSQPENNRSSPVTERARPVTTRSQDDFDRACTEGEIDPDRMTGKKVAKWASVSASTGRRWLRERAVPAVSPVTPVQSVEPVDWHCTTCNYTTASREKWNEHCASNRHKMLVRTAAEKEQ